MSGLILPSNYAPQPESRPAINLAIYHWRKNHGDIEVIGTWFGKEYRPCIVLIMAQDYGRKSQTKRAPCVVRMDNAWIYEEEEIDQMTMEEIGGDTILAMEQAALFCPKLGLEPSIANQHRIISIVRNHLDDLLHIPPRPQVDRMAVGEIKITNEDRGVVHHVEVTEDV